MNGATGGPAAVALKQRTFLGHPIGLYILFFTEMWERFSYYGMRALLVLYMVNYFKWMQSDASAIYKWYTSLVYLTPLLGGYLADRFLGNKKAVVIGAILMAIGHFLMAFEAIEVFMAALIFLILGNGMFKPNMSTQVGRLYPQNDARRDGAYTIFYMGINLGAFLSPLVCGWLAANTVGGYHTGFTMAGIGMVCGLLIYVFGMRWVVELDQGDKKKKDEAQAADVTAGAAGQADAFAVALRQLQKPNGETGVVQVPLAGPPPAFDPAHAGLTAEQLKYDATTGMLTATAPLTDVQVAAVLKAAGAGAAPVEGAMSEEQAARTPSNLPWLNWVSPGLLAVVGCILGAGTLLLALCRLLAWGAGAGFLRVVALNDWVANDTLIGLGIVAVCTLISSWILFSVKNAERDRVLAIYGLGVFVVFFWAAFEQAGNAMNLWADKTTDRYLSQPAPVPSPFPETTGGDASPQGGAAAQPVKATGLMGWITMWQLKPTAAKNQSWWDWWVGLWNPVSTEWFQSINALAIFVLAPIFAFFWVWLERRRLNPSTPIKMAFGVLLMSASFGLMIFAARWEDGATDVTFAGALPQKVHVNDKNQLLSAEAGRPYQAGRLTYDAAAHTLHLHGVLSDLEHDLMVRETAPDDYAAALKDLQKKAADLPADAFGKITGDASVHLDHVPPGFDLRYAGFDKSEVSFDDKTQTLTVTGRRLADKDVKALLVAGGDEAYRKAADELYQKAAQFQVSSWWLFWFYILSTLGELCLSPVGLSMVSKLAPARFATMLMGLWLLTSFFGNFAAGACGEIYDSTTPTTYFLYIMGALAGAALVLFVLAHMIKGMMHGVK
jgi:dipeptide/tripeptide permease